MRGTLRLLGASLLGTLSVSLILTGTAMAHERRSVGNYQFVVGWTVEPAFLGEKNGIDLRVTQAPAEGQSASGTQGEAEPPPVVGLEKTLKAEIISGADRREVSLRGVFRQPGRYTADVVPTRAGDYRFRFFGTIDGMQIDETFDSADGKFHGVEPIEAISFPEKVPSAPEIAEQVTQTRQLAEATERAVGAARALGTGGLAAGALGVILAAVALARGRRAGAPG